MSSRRAHLGRLVHPFRRVDQPACEEVRDLLPEILDGGELPAGALVDHVERCLLCQAELARYRRLMRLLHQVRAVEVAVPAGIVGDVLASIERAASRRAVRSVLTGRRLAYASAVLGAAGAGTALAVLALGRSREDRPSLSKGELSI
ncbi:MAG TPA: hypothetical protein VFN50_12475 [Acidimicrobiales bacterium]|nr:hypothetical protein [Acidimicrobiales bacterium]